MTVDATLAAIDGALEDWGTSGDAMRWQPDPDRVICDGGRPFWPERWNVWRHGTYQLAVSYAPFTEFGRPPVLNPAAMPCADFLRESLLSFARWGEAYILAARPLVEAFSAAGEQMLEFGHQLAMATEKAFGIPPSLLGIGGHEHRTARCRTCNPAGNPRPLAINGAAYRSRQRNRRKRGR